MLPDIEIILPYLKNVLRTIWLLMYIIQVTFTSFNKHCALNI